MSDESTADTTDTVEGDISDAAPAEGGVSDATLEGSDLKSDQDPETFPREVVEELRRENGRYRKRAGQADALAQRLHAELVRATGRLADPADLEFAEEHLDDPEKLSNALDDLLERKPHLATRKPSGDIGQGNRGGSPEPVSLLQMLRERA